MGRIIKKGFFWGQKSVLKLWSVLLGFLLTQLFGCKPSFVATDYGIMIAEYQIKGRVTSSTNGEALSGISVKSDYDSVVTDVNGEYSLTSFSEYECALSFDDIDSSNGVHASVDTLIGVTPEEVDSGLKTFDITMDPVDNDTQD